MYLKKRNGISTASAITIIVIIIIAAIVGGYLYYTSLPSPAPTPTKRGVITIGVTLSFKGKLMHEGTYSLHGMLVAIKWVNEHGGVKVGDKVYNLTLKYYDDESNPKRVPELYSKLIEQDKVNFLFFPYSSTLGKAAAPVAESHKMVMVSHGSASDTIYQQGYKYVLLVSNPASRRYRLIADWLASLDDPNIKVALIYEDSPWSALCARGFEEEASKLGLNVVYKYAYERGAQEFGSIINEAKASGANVLVGGGHFADGTALTQQAWQLGWKLKAVALGIAPALHEFYTQLGDIANGVIYPSQWESTAKYSPEVAKKKGLEWYGPTQDEFMSLYKKMYPDEIPDYHATEASQAVLVLAKAIEVAGSLDQDAVRQAFNQLDIMTFFGRFKINPDTGLQIGKQVLLVQWQNGKQIIVWPSEVAEAKPVYPASNWWSR